MPKKPFHANSQRKDGDKARTEKHRYEATWDVIHPAGLHGALQGIAKSYRHPLNAQRQRQGQPCKLSFPWSMCYVLALSWVARPGDEVHSPWTARSDSSPLGLLQNAASVWAKSDSCCFSGCWFWFFSNICLLPSPHMDAVSRREAMFRQHKGWCAVKTAKVEPWSREIIQPCLDKSS